MGTVALAASQAALAASVLSGRPFSFFLVLASMGVGSYLSKHVHEGLVARFIDIELLVGLLGGISASGGMLNTTSSASNAANAWTSPCSQAPM